MLQHREFRALGCAMQVFSEAVEPGHLAQIEQWFLASERTLSRFQATSQLSQLNAHGWIVNADPLLWQALRHAITMARWTQGLVTPTVLNALRAAGYATSFEQVQALNERTTAHEVPTWQAILCDPLRSGISLPPGVQLDLGGTAKGWLVDLALERLARPALIDAGGDIGISGPRADGQPWAIGVPHPMDADVQIALLALSQGAVATSGSDYRRWRRGSGWAHHLIDPRTGDCATSDVLSATVIAPDTAHADVAAKVVLLLGSQAGLEWLEQQAGFAGLVVTQSGAVVASSRMAEWYWPGTKEVSNV